MSVTHPTTSHSHPLRDLVARHHAGAVVGITSVCSAHPIVLEAAARQASADGSLLLVEATSNQVDQDGGYTGLRPADFAALVHDVVDRVGFPRHRLVLGGDHLGPNRWRDAGADDAMNRAEVLVAAYVRAGFTKIHLDCSMVCAGDPTPLPGTKVAERAARLARVAHWQVHADYSLIVAGNRDEFHDRPAAPLAWSPDWPDVAAGRDLQAGGTWLGVARDGRLGVVTNFRDPAQPSPSGAPSRGRLVPDYLLHEQSPAQFVSTLEPTANRYAGFNLLLADRSSLVYTSNRTPRSPRTLAPGIYGLSNGELDEPWPKLVRTRERFTAAIARERPDTAELFALLADRTSAIEPAMPGLPPDWQRAVSAPFVVHERYGTRCTTVVLIDREGRSVMHERRFDANGDETGVSRLEFGGDLTAGATTSRPAARTPHGAPPFASSPE